MADVVLKRHCKLLSFFTIILSKDEDIDREVNTRLAKLAIVLRLLDNAWKSFLLFSWAEDQAAIMSTAVCP